MKRSDGIELLKFSIETVLKKYGKWYLKMRGNPVYFAFKRLFFQLKNDLTLQKKW